MKSLKISLLFLVVGMVGEVNSASGSVLINDPLYLGQRAANDFELTNDPLYLQQQSAPHDYEYDPAGVVLGEVHSPLWDTSFYKVAGKASRQAPTPEVSKQPFETPRLIFETPGQVFERLFKDHRAKGRGDSSKILLALEPLVQSVDAKVCEMELYQDVVTATQRDRIIQSVTEFNALLATVNALLFGEKSKKSSFTGRRTAKNIKEIDAAVQRLDTTRGAIDLAVTVLVEPHKAAKEAAKLEEQKKLFATAKELNDLLLLKFLRETGNARWNDNYSKLSDYEKDANLLLNDGTPQLKKRPLTPDTKRRVFERMEDVRARADAVRYEESYRRGGFAVPNEDGSGVSVVHSPAFWSPTHSL